MSQGQQAGPLLDVNNPPKGTQVKDQKPPQRAADADQGRPAPVPDAHHVYVVKVKK